MSIIADNIQGVQNNIAQSCERSGRDLDDIKLVAVSKRKPISAIIDAIDAGLQHFGENRVEESQDKIPNLRTDNPVTWHMIGHIQSRKAKYIAPLFQYVHSIDSVKIAQRIAKTIIEPTKLDVLIQINVSGEDSKGGINAFNWQSDTGVQKQLRDEIQQIAALPQLSVRGLMTMAPIVDDLEATRPVFRNLAKLRDELQQQLGLPFPELSMGMTDDYQIAVEEGATIIRVGRAIFGERKQ